MIRLPVLAGAAGALGATYCPPYLAVDGAYHAHPSGQTSSLSSVSRSVMLVPQLTEKSCFFFFFC